MKISKLIDLIEQHPEVEDIDFAINFTNGIHCGETSEDTMNVSLSNMHLSEYWKYDLSNKVISLECRG